MMTKNKFLSPFQQFVQTESFAGILLFAATLLALIWANSPYAFYYNEFRQITIGFKLGSFELVKPLILWINDGLMAIFFFVIGLELKRELIAGEINSIKKAAFPVLAALGGIIIPILLFVVLNENPEYSTAWGIPMATDIAFALAILSLLGNKVPLSLKVFLTAFAIIDDLAAVSVIAVFYTDDLKLNLLLWGLLLIGLIALWYYKKKYHPLPGILVGIIVWYLFLKAGIHPTIAGVLLAFTIPIKRRMDVKKFSGEMSSIADKLVQETSQSCGLLTTEELKRIAQMKNLMQEVTSPLQSLEQKLHSFVAFFILPLFAFANAGVSLKMDASYEMDLVQNIAISLFIGKFIGVLIFSYLGLKWKITTLPKGMRFSHIIGVSALAGVGFTMSIFIANLAFRGQIHLIDSSKVGIIIGSFLAGISGYLILRFTKSKN
jgi:NhaA family Na+:H+ antiporter